MNEILPLTDPRAFRAEVLASPLATAPGCLPSQLMRNAAKGWYIGLSLNA